MNKTIIIIVVAIVVGGGAFFGGMKYQQRKSPFGVSRQAFQGLSSEQRQQFAREGIGRETGAGVRILNGEVVAKDEQALTLKMPDGSSRIVFFSDSTEISKTIEGSIVDIEIGRQITITGAQNSDGSYTASTIQLIPRSFIPRN